ncbi:MAG: hypothetical protein CL780_05570 [Chloroflexi bacterium]|nr:hypothetical protein [Chloroflexota bacterium]|tara:strand:+ start:264 stop:749 length:486 start_codon:yes stop_codon:yes gene_type:complete
MKSENLHIVYKILTFSSLSLLFMFVVSGCLNSEPPLPPGQQIDTSTTEEQEDISQEVTNEFVNDTGIVIDELNIVPKGTLGGDVIINVTNSGSEECLGLAINVDLVSESKDVVASVGKVLPDPIPPNEKATIKEMFIGKGVTEIVVTDITCDAKCTSFLCP